MPVGYFYYVEPPHSYVLETSTSVVHHGDYLNRRDDQAFCGAALENPAALDPTSRPVAVCPDCEAKVVEYHLKWWRERAEAATAELDELRVKYRELAEYVDDERRQVTEVPSGEKPESRREIDEEPQTSSTAEQDETTPTSLLGQARKELLELCRGFDETVPFFRVKNSMEAFSDKLKSDERVLLAQEIGADGSLIRWCTKEIEGLGLQVSNNPVHGDADAMMDAWTQDLYQT
ncbi:hypothetical protein, partial [Mycobacterium sp.]|uniref:hypothetical protein n=1 Tax=Mycobacterium sp. TaxID=1785 RepID=UPI002D952EAF|nr:hypothetical protein [Mycobacterium sp.]